MNRPDKPGELSIDEILASIRQNISEEPDAPQSALDAVPEASPPVVPSHAAPPPPPETPPSLKDRLNGTFSSKSAGATAGAAGTNGAKRPLPFDQDLADILDEPETASVASAAPKPEVRGAPEVAPFGGQKPLAAVANAVTETAPAAASSSPSSSPSSDPAPAPPLVAPAPFGRGFAESPAPPRPQTFGFPPLTKKAGFFPPERSEPVLPPVRSDGLDKPAVPLPHSSLPAKEPSPAPTLSSANGNAADRASTIDPATRFPDFGSVVPSDVVGRGQPTPDSSFGSPPRAGSGAAAHGGMNGLSLRPSQFDPSEQQPSLDREPRAPSLSATASPIVASPAVPEPAKTSFTAMPDRAAVPTEAASKDAATDALGALAQGLAASTAKSDAPDFGAAPLHDRAAVSVANPQRTAGASAAAPATPAPVAPQPAPDSAAAPARTLEDVVADMLRPMLQKWVAENMPRIMEKALRSEMQRTLGSGGGAKPPGS